MLVDEIGRKADAEAIHEAIYAGVHIVTTAHGSSPSEVQRRPNIRELLNEGVFTRLVVLSRRSGPGTIEAIYDNHGKLLRGIRCSS
jgi:stage III sporulation protein AA